MLASLVFAIVQLKRHNLSLPMTGLDKIEFLQSHENVDIYRRALRVIETYFGSQDDDRVVLNTSANPLLPSAPHGSDFRF